MISESFFLNQNSPNGIRDGECFFCALSDTSECITLPHSVKIFTNFYKCVLKLCVKVRLNIYTEIIS